MKKTTTKLLALALAAVMPLTLAGCSGSQGTSETKAEAQKGGEAEAPKKAKGEWPAETITLVCPFSAGGGTDIGARNMATALGKELGVNVVVENQTGSGGWIAWTDLITGDYDDGYTVGLINHNYAMGEL